MSVALPLAFERAGRSPSCRTRRSSPRTRELGENNLQTLYAVWNLAVLYRDTSRLGEAEELMRSGLRRAEAAWEPDHHLALRMVGDLGSIYLGRGRLADADMKKDLTSALSFLIVAKAVVTRSFSDSLVLTCVCAS